MSTINLADLAAAIGQLVLRFRLRRRTAADWTSTNEVLLGAELGVETDTGKTKIGDGTTGWNALSYWPPGGSALTAGAGIDITTGVVSNTGVITVTAGSGISVNDTDPQNIIVTATGGGGGSFPLPDGCIAWFSTSHRNGVSGKAVNYLNAPVDGPPRGLIAYGGGGGPAFAADGSVASGGIFTLTAPLFMGDCTILAVVKTPAALGSGSASTIFSGTAGSALQFRIENSGGTLALQLVKSSVAGIGDDVSSGSLGASTKILVGATLTGGAWTLRRDGSQTTSGTTASTPTSLNNAIGTNSGAGEDATHQLYDLVIFDRVLGSTDMATAENYLKTLNGL